MREIKFRAWDKVCKPNRIKTWEQLLAQYQLAQVFVSDYFILMQYTGLKDKNGKDIYEGDICKNGGGMIGEIVFNEFAWMFRWKSGNYYPFGQWCEVIGNIYENPELLGIHHED